MTLSATRRPIPGSASAWFDASLLTDKAREQARHVPSKPVRYERSLEE